MTDLTTDAARLSCVLHEMDALYRGLESFRLDERIAERSGDAEAFASAKIASDGARKDWFAKHVEAKALAESLLIDLDIPARMLKSVL